MSDGNGHDGGAPQPGRTRKATRPGRRRSLRVPVDDVPRRASMPDDGRSSVPELATESTQVTALPELPVEASARAAPLPEVDDDAEELSAEIEIESATLAELDLPSEELALAPEELGASMDDGPPLDDLEEQPTRVAPRSTPPPRPASAPPPPRPATTPPPAIAAASPTASVRPKPASIVPPPPPISEPDLELDDESDEGDEPGIEAREVEASAAASDESEPALHEQPAARAASPADAPRQDALESAAVVDADPPREPPSSPSLIARASVPSLDTAVVIVSRVVRVTSPPPALDGAAPPKSEPEDIDLVVDEEPPPARVAEPAPDLTDEAIAEDEDDAPPAADDALIMVAEPTSEELDALELEARDSTPSVEIDPLPEDDEEDGEASVARSAPPPPRSEKAQKPAPKTTKEGAAPPPAPSKDLAAHASPPEPRRAKRKAHWWEEFFNDDYLRTVPPAHQKHVTRTCDFVEQRLGLKPGATILDVGCGLGLHAVELTRRGYLVVGLDLSLPMLSRAADEAQDHGFKINFLHADMREMNFEGSFDAVICLGTTFGYFDDEQNKAVVERLYRALRPKGLLLLDVDNRDFVVAAQPNLVWFEGDGCVVMEETTFNFITSRLHVKRTVILDDGRQRDNQYSIRMYSLHELGQVLHQRGFRVVEVSGREATAAVFFGADSPRLLIVAERRLQAAAPPVPPKKSARPSEPAPPDAEPEG